MALAASIKSVFHSLLIFSVVLTYGIGGAAAIEVKHAHEHEGVHEHVSDAVGAKKTKSAHHHHHDEHHSHSDDSTDSGDKTEDSESEPEGSPHSHPHTHIVSLDTHFSFPNQASPILETSGWMTARFVAENENCPEGPFYELVKPPQIA